MEDKRDYGELYNFQQQLCQLTIEYLKKKIVTPTQTNSTDNLIGFIEEIENRPKHELYPELENFQYILATLSELETYMNELEFSRDPSTRKAAIKFLEEALINLQVLSDPYSKQKIVTVNFNEYTIKGFRGITSWGTLWMSEYPVELAKKIAVFSNQWKEKNIIEIIPELDPKESLRAQEEKKKKESSFQIFVPDAKKTVDHSSASSKVYLAEDSTSDAELSERGEEKHKHKESHSGSEAEVSEGAKRKTVGPKSQLDAGERNSSETTDQTSEDPDSSTVEDSDAKEPVKPDKIQPIDKEKPDVAEDVAPEDFEEYTYEDYFVDEDEVEDDSDPVSEHRSSNTTKVADPNQSVQEHTLSIDEKKSKAEKLMTPIKRRVVKSDGESFEEEIFEEFVTPQNKSQNQKDKRSPTHEELEAEAADLLEETREFRESLGDGSDSIPEATPPQSTGKSESSTGFSVLRDTNPALFQRLVRRSMDRKCLAGKETPDEDQVQTVEKAAQEALSPMSALLADSEDHIRRNTNAHRIRADDENADDDEEYEDADESVDADDEEGHEVEPTNHHATTVARKLF